MSTWKCKSCDGSGEVESENGGPMTCQSCGGNGFIDSEWFKPAPSKAGIHFDSQEEYLKALTVNHPMISPPIPPGKDMPENTYRCFTWFWRRIMDEVIESREYAFLDESWQQWAFESLALKALTLEEMRKQARQMVAKKVEREEKRMASKAE